MPALRPDRGTLPDLVRPFGCRTHFCAAEWTLRAHGVIDLITAEDSIFDGRRRPRPLPAMIEGLRKVEVADRDAALRTEQ